MTKISQTLRRTRRLILKTTPKLLGVHKKIDRREAKREGKALQAARLEISIEKELLNRLKMGVYPDGIVNESSEAFAKAMDTLEDLADIEAEMEEEEEEELEREFVSDMSDEEDLEDFSGFGPESLSDDSDEDMTKKSGKKHVAIEYEHEHEAQQQQVKW